MNPLKRIINKFFPKREPSKIIYRRLMPNYGMYTTSYAVRAKEDLKHMPEAEKWVGMCVLVEDGGKVYDLVNLDGDENWKATDITNKIEVDRYWDEALKLNSDQ